MTAEDAGKTQHQRPTCFQYYLLENSFPLHSDVVQASDLSHSSVPQSLVAWRMWQSSYLLVPVVPGSITDRNTCEACCVDILECPTLRSGTRRVKTRKKAQGKAQAIHSFPEGQGEGRGLVGEGRLRFCFVIPNNCGLILQVCIRKYKARQFVGSSNFQSPESSKNYFSYPR